MTLKNSNYSMHRNSCHRRIILLISTYLICLFAFSETPSFMVHLIFLMFLLWLSISLSSLVESETVKVISHSGIEKSVKYSFGRRQSVFIASQSIFKLVINEVIYFVSLALCDPINLLNNPYFVLPESGYLCSTTFDS